MPSTTKPRPVRIAGAVLAALGIIAGGVTSIAGLDDRPEIAMWAGLVTLTVGALTATLIPVLEGQVVPAGDVIGYLDADRQVVVGPGDEVLVDDSTGHPEAADTAGDEPGAHRPEVVGAGDEPYFERP